MDNVEFNSIEGVRIRVKWIIDVVNRCTFDYYDDKQVIELKQVMQAYNILVTEYPKEFYDVLKEEGIDYVEFTVMKMGEIRNFINNYNQKRGINTSRARI